METSSSSWGMSLGRPGNRCQAGCQAGTSDNRTPGQPRITHILPRYVTKRLPEENQGDFVFAFTTVILPRRGGVKPTVTVPTTTL